VLGTLSKRAADIPRSQINVARASTHVLAYQSRVRLNAARERTACARIQAIVRAMTLPENMVRKCAAAPARNYSMLLGDTRVSTWILRSVQRQCCA